MVAAVVLVAPGFFLAPAWRLAGLGIGEDEALYYLPSRAFFGEHVRRGHWPALNPLTGLGRPFAADPQSAVWYPPTWVFALADPVPVYAVLLWGHYVLAAWGTYRLSRALGAVPPAALFAGIAFAFSGFMLAHRAHFAMQNAAAWTPVVVWLLHRAALAGGRRVAWAAVAVTMQCLSGHAQVAAITALGSLAWTVAQQRRVPLALPRWVAVWALAVGLFAVQWVPTALYVRECTRVQNDYWDFTQNSWHPASALTAVMPMLLGQRLPNLFDQPWWGPSHQTEQFAYTGIVPALLALAAIRGAWRGGAPRRAALALGASGVLLALGKYGPICPLLYALPGSNLFRVPARALLLAHLAAALLAGFSLHDLMIAATPATARLRAALLAWTRRPVALAAALLALCLVAAGVGGLVAGGAARKAAWAAVAPWRPAVWVPLIVVTSSLAAVHSLARRWRRPAHGALFCAAVTAADLAVVGWTLDVPAGWPKLDEWLRPPAREQWARHVAAASGRLWVVTDTAGVYHDPIRKGAANTNMLLGIASLTDYGPLQPRLMRDRFRFAPWGVTERAAELLIDSGWMAACNVRWILVCDPALPPPAGCEPVMRTTSGERLFRNDRALGAAFIEDATGTAAARVRGGRDTLRADVDAAPSGTRRRLVLSQVGTAGWRASIDGRAAPIRAAHDVLMSVDLPETACSVTWVYSTPGLRMGAFASGATAVAILAAVALRSARRRRRSRVVTAEAPASG